ncbi:uncharacterized protein LOC27209180 [Drosophila simulans]|uniref:uncharacterized protein LOC27209180 n=1 Tax=Drosophila simulans TaxID=7240 RepID=UPI00078AEC11|nr:uncharacterized protein LOC27209180 [Drosophila simulans]XP_039147872.1 uncharacterized protein LOC27209180 [Drosophila simulans]XP_039147873.1 uncharacterized protein LOC27209180 [Drosophila simulans]XP_039147874.1 uncharacterized protein LOC27209180 [Drosophila simulans]XP_039147875.1 uncharacterized protein LOC27209180 [Drosophila simulans]KMY87161.1 uncharacterized protein Dsimw501_GD29337, isoform A [Drosophila simulans]KMY87162.1 uncharacterized protein Dsimw501_GD29337, isoform B [D
MHSVGIHSAMAIKRQRKRRDEQKRARERRYSTQSSESGETFHSPTGSVRRKYHHPRHAVSSGPGMLDSQVVTSIGMLHIGIVFVVFGVFLCGAGIIPDETMSWKLFSSSSAWWNEVTCTGLFSLGLGLFLLVLNCLISRKEEEDLEDYVQRQLTRSRSGHRLERDVETGVLTTRHARKAVALQKGGRNNSPTDVSVVNCGSSENMCNGPIVVHNVLNSSDAILEKIVEEDNAYLNDRSSGISPIDLENDKKQLLRRESLSDAISITRI